jgi:hypothetical protein
MSREQDFITIARQHNRAVWEALHALKAMQAEWNALDYGNTLDDGDGSNIGITSAEVGSVVFGTTDAMHVVLAAGHATNMAKLL